MGRHIFVMDVMADRAQAAVLKEQSPLPAETPTAVVAESGFDLAASPDKDFIVIEGAAHGIVPCTACEKTKGQYSNTVKNTFDYMKQWIDKRF